MTEIHAQSPFFVVGASRSGTTLLRLILTSHSAVHVPRETWFLIDLMGSLPSDRPLSRSEVAVAETIIRGHPRWHDWEIGDSALHRAFAAQTEPHLRDLIRSLYALDSERIGKPIWGDKTPGYVTHIQALSRLIPDSRFVHVIRDARDTCRSLSGQGWYGRALYRAGAYWAKSVGAGIAQGRALPRQRYLEVHYEDLVLDTEHTVRDVCGFLRIPFEEEMLRFHHNDQVDIPDWARRHHRKLSRPPRPDDVGVWRRTMGRRGIFVVEVMAGHVMRAAGQECMFPPPFGVLRFGLEPVDYVLRATHPWRQRRGLDGQQLLSPR